jgi:hypothetical protein
LLAGLRAGAFPVRWMPDAAYGLGYPFFNYYAALPYYVAAGLRLLGWGPIRALQATQALGFMLAGVTMALLARRVLRHPAAVVLAAVAYTCAPFHLVNVYVRGDSLSEFYAFVFYPLILWALLCLKERPSRAGVAWLALSYGGLILTHNLSALMFSPFVAAFALWVVFGPGSRRGMEIAAPAGERNARRWHVLAWILGGGLLGLALAASLWWTAAAELDEVWMGVKDIQTTGYFNYAGHFRSPLGTSGNPLLVQPTLFFAYDTPLARCTPFAMSAVQVMAITLGGAAWGIAAARKAKDILPHPLEWTPFWLLGLVASTFLITPLSRPLWDYLPVLPIVQFPWRFLSVQAFFGALVVGELALRLPRPWWVALATTVLLTVTVVGGLRPEYLAITEADVTPERLALFESFTANVGTTIRSEYLPAGVEPGLRASAVTLNRGQRPPPRVLAGDLSRAILEHRDARTERWRITVASEQAHLAFYTLYFPGWRARLGNDRVPIEPLPNSGLISVRAPRGEHVVTLRFGRSGVRRVADSVSLAALLAIGLLLALDARALAWRSRRPVFWIVSWGLLLLGGLAFLGWALSLPQAQPAQNDLSMDFDRLPFLHHNPDGIDYDRARLLSYDYADEAGGGSVWTATLHWAARESPNGAWVAELQLVSPANPLDLAPLPPPLALSRALIEGSTTVHSLDIPQDIPSGPYHVALRVYAGSGASKDEVKAINARGETLGTTYLRPVWVDNPRPAQADEALWARFGDRIVLRDGVETQSTEGHWEVSLTWQATDPVTANYTLSLHALAADGRSLSQRDWAEGPGYGFWPTTAWSVGEWLTDHLRLAVPDGVNAQDAAAISVILYDRSQPSYPALGTTVVPLESRGRDSLPPVMDRRIGATFGQRAILLGYDLQPPSPSAQAPWLRLALYWQALSWDLEKGNPPPDYLIFCHLYDPETEEIVVQSDARPLNGVYPTNAWQVGEVIGEEIVLPLEDVPAGIYRLAVGMYEVMSKDRATIVEAGGETVPGGRLILEDKIKVSAR